MQEINYDSLEIGSKIDINEHGVFGILTNNEAHLILQENVIEKGCFYENDDMCYFARYPNF